MSQESGTTEPQRDWTDISLSEEPNTMSNSSEELCETPAPSRKGIWGRRTGLEKGLLAFVGVVGVVMVAGASFYVLQNQNQKEEGEYVGRNMKSPGKEDVCTTPECTVAASNIINALNQSAEPCEDFYQFACGGWMDKHDIPPSMSTYGQFDILDEEVRKAVKAVLEAPKDPNGPKTVGMAKDMYTACTDIESVNSFGLKMWIAIAGPANEYGGWPIAQDNWDPSKFNPSKFMGHISNNLNIKALLEIGIGPDEQNVTRNIIYLDQPSSLGLLRSMFVEPDNFEDIIKAYKQFMKDLAVYTVSALDSSVTQDEIDAEVEKLFEFETKLAQIMKPDEDRRNSSAMYNPMTLGEIKANYKEIEWDLYFEDYLVETGISVSDDEVIIVTEPDFFTELGKLIAETDEELLANYIYLRALYSLSKEGPIDLADIYFKFSSVLNGIDEQPSRSTHCVELISAPFVGMGGLGFAVSHEYVKTYFSEASKEQANALVDNLRAAFRELLDESEWMDEETIAKAQEKGDAMLQLLGYPDWLLDNDKLDEFYTGLEAPKVDTHMANVEYVRRYEARNSIRQLRDKPDREFWYGHPAVVNAFYSPNHNTITFPAGILQSPFFKNGHPRYLNYGAIGVVIGHEITHGFDDEGRQYDGEGNAIPWWSEETIAAFTERAQCFVDQYDGYKVPELEDQLGEDAHVNGKNTLGENIADNGGVHEAFRAYMKSVESNGTEPGLPGLAQFTSEQLFFISFSQVWCEERTLESLLSQILGNVHSPGKYRVWGALSNSPDFAEAFQCPVGSPMNRGDEACVLW